MPLIQKMVVGCLVLSLTPASAGRQHANSSWSASKWGGPSDDDYDYIPEPSWTKIPKPSDIVEKIAVLLQEQQLKLSPTVRTLASRADSSAKSMSGFTRAMYSLVSDMTTKIEEKIKRDQSQTQEKMDLLSRNHFIADKSATASKQAADQEDKASFECIAGEQSKRVGAESAVKSLTDSRSNENEACQRFADSSSFSYDGSNTRLQFTCEVGKGDCVPAQNGLEQSLEKMKTQASRQLQAKKAAFQKLKSSCNAKKQERVQAQSALNGAESAWNSQKQVCQKLAPHREETMCVFGSNIQTKCKAESDYKLLIQASKTANSGADSQVDRIEEWKSISTAKCLVQKFILKLSATTADVNHCLKQVDFGKDVGYLNRREKQFEASVASNPCGAGGIRFFNGQAWTVPSSAKPKSSEYTRSKFAPVISMNGNAFDFCTASSVREGATLHMMDDGECGVSLSGAHTRSVDHIDTMRYHEGARAESWGCDRVKQMNNLELLKAGSKQYLVSHC